MEQIKAKKFSYENKTIINKRLKKVKKIKKGRRIIIIKDAFFLLPEELDPRRARREPNKPNAGKHPEAKLKRRS